MWTYFILKEKEKYGLVELFYESKYKKTPKKISGYTDFIIEGENKTQILNTILKLMNGKIKLENGYNREDYIMMYKDIRKSKIMEISSIKFLDISKKYNLTNKNFINL